MAKTDEYMVTARASAPTAGPPRAPIRIALLKFDARYPQDGPFGTFTGSALREERQENKERRSIEYHPWMRAFLVAITRTDGTAKRGYIPEGRVMYFEPADE